MWHSGRMAETGAAATRRATNTPWRTGVAAMVVVVAVLLAVRVQSHNAAPATSSTAPASWRLPALTGAGQVSLAGLRGHPLVVDFFASWCTACRGELSEMADVSQRLRGRVTFAGVDSLESGDGAAMARQYRVSWWPLARDVGGAQASGLHDALGARGMPVTAFYDASGRLRTVVTGAIGADDLRARLHALFGVTT